MAQGEAIAKPSAFEEQSTADQINGLIWVLGFVSYALLRCYRAPIRFRIAFQRTALYELEQVAQIGIIRSDPLMFRHVHRAREATLAVYPDARAQFAKAAIDEVSRVIDLLRERKVEHGS